MIFFISLQDFQRYDYKMMLVIGIMLNVVALQGAKNEWTPFGQKYNNKPLFSNNF